MESFQEFFNSRLREKGFSLERLAEMTGITVKHLRNLSHGDFAHLPAAPYLRGYLIRIGEALDFDGEAYWREIEAQNSVFRSGAGDQLPKNRFARRSLGALIPLSIAALLLLGYIGIRSAAIIGRPTITLTAPTETLTRTIEDSIAVTGSIENGTSVLVNNESIPLRDDSSFETTVRLEPGLNLIEITGSKFLGSEVKLLRQVVYEPPIPRPGATTSTTTSTPSSSDDGTESSESDVVQ